MGTRDMDSKNYQTITTTGSRDRSRSPLQTHSHLEPIPELSPTNGSKLRRLELATIDESAKKYGSRYDRNKVVE